ncbi:MAG TPA: hypothetical protein ENI66_00400, partial [Candidatus Yonathbacteria bacterium]|nr:hypothetical protein [Candidatus Yonathbacteria bacterium]
MKNELIKEQDKHKFCNVAIAFKGDLEWKYIELGAMLYRIRKERLYEAGWSSWDEYTMEFKLSKSSISRLLRVYE